MEYTIDLRNVKDPESMHDIIEYSLPVPEYYGRNLDALYDVLTSMPADTVITVFTDKDLTPECIDMFLNVCEDAAVDAGLDIMINPDDM
jgi:ribonuclease inhibitor